MAGTKQGGARAAATNKSKYGADFYSKIGTAGGKGSRGYGFGHGKADPVEAGRKGGTISRRTKTYVKTGTQDTVVVNSHRGLLDRLFLRRAN